MNLEAMKSTTTEIFVTGNGVSVTANPWANCEGLSVMIHSEGAGLPIRAAFSLRWEELDVLNVALAAARSS